MQGPALAIFAKVEHDDAVRENRLLQQCLKTLCVDRSRQLEKCCLQEEGFPQKAWTKRSVQPLLQCNVRSPPSISAKSLGKEVAFDMHTGEASLIRSRAEPATIVLV
jgi:hypothetical protein